MLNNGSSDSWGSNSSKRLCFKSIFWWLPQKAWLGVFLYKHAFCSVQAVRRQRLGKFADYWLLGSSQKGSYTRNSKYPNITANNQRLSTHWCHWPSLRTSITTVGLACCLWEKGWTCSGTHSLRGLLYLLSSHTSMLCCAWSEKTPRGETTLLTESVSNLLQV